MLSEDNNGGKKGGGKKQQTFHDLVFCVFITLIFYGAGFNKVTERGKKIQKK
jgi:hypothetical protein